MKTLCTRWTISTRFWRLTPWWGGQWKVLQLRGKILKSQTWNMVLEISLVHIDFSRQWYIKTKTSKYLVLLNFSDNGISRQDKHRKNSSNSFPPTSPLSFLTILSETLSASHVLYQGCAPRPAKRRLWPAPRKLAKVAGRRAEKLISIHWNSEQ